MPNSTSPDRFFVISDPTTLKVLSDPLRLEMLRAFRQPRTVKELSHMVGVPVGKLYYHVKLLEERELIRVVEANVVSGIVERTYRVSASQYRVDESLFNAEDAGGESHLEKLLLSFFEDCKRQALRSARAGLLVPPTESSNSRGILTGVSAPLTENQAEIVQGRLEELIGEIEEMGEANRGAGVGRAYALSNSFFRGSSDARDQDSQAKAA